MNKAKVAAIYCRVSTDEQGRDGTSLDTQLQASLARANALGYAVSEKHVFREMYSGLALERPLLTELRRLIYAKAIDAIIAYTLDRLSRDPTHFIILQEEMEKAGVELIFVTEDVDSSDLGKLVTYIKGYAAKLEAQKIGERTSRGKRERAKQGKHPSSAKMFGFDMVDGKRVINQAEAAAIRQAIDVALREGRTGPGARWLNNQGFTTKYRKPWTIATLVGPRGLFRNKALIGETTINFKQGPVVIRHEPILNTSTFEALQTMLNRGHLRASRAEIPYYMGGIAYCGCGSKFEGTKIGKLRYYRCRQFCGERYWRKEYLEWDVFNSFWLYLQRRDNLQGEIQLTTETGAKLRERLLRVKVEAEAVERKWMTLLKKELAGELDDYPREVVESEKDELKAKTEVLKIEEAKLKAELEALPRIDPAQVEAALDELAGPWQMCNTGGYGIRHPMSWETARFASGDYKLERPRKLTDDQGKLLRETLFKLGCRVTIKNHAVFISGRLPISAKKSTTLSDNALDKALTSIAL